MTNNEGHLVFSHQLAVRTDDINEANHLDANRIFVLVRNVRALFFKANGSAEADCFGCAMFILEQSAQYKGQAYFDDTLNFEVFLEAIKGVTVLLRFRVTNQNGDLIANVYNTLGCYDLSQRKLVHASPAMRDFFMRDDLVISIVKT